MEQDSSTIPDEEAKGGQANNNKPISILRSSSLRKAKRKTMEGSHSNDDHEVDDHDFMMGDFMDTPNNDLGRLVEGKSDHHHHHLDGPDTMNRLGGGASRDVGFLYSPPPADSPRRLDVGGGVDVDTKVMVDLAVAQAAQEALALSSPESSGSGSESSSEDDGEDETEDDEEEVDNTQNTQPDDTLDPSEVQETPQNEPPTNKTQNFDDHKINTVGTKARDGVYPTPLPMHMAFSTKHNSPMDDSDSHPIPFSGLKPHSNSGHFPSNQEMLNNADFDMGLADVLDADDILKFCDKQEALEPVNASLSTVDENVAKDPQSFQTGHTGVTLNPQASAPTIEATANNGSLDNDEKQPASDTTEEANADDGAVKPAKKPRKRGPGHPKKNEDKENGEAPKKKRARGRPPKIDENGNRVHKKKRGRPPKNSGSDKENGPMQPKTATEGEKEGKATNKKTATKAKATVAKAKLSPTRMGNFEKFKLTTKTSKAASKKAGKPQKSFLKRGRGRPRKNSLQNSAVEGQLVEAIDAAGEENNALVVDDGNEVVSNSGGCETTTLPMEPSQTENAVNNSANRTSLKLANNSSASAPSGSSARAKRTSDMKPRSINKSNASFPNNDIVDFFSPDDTVAHGFKAREAATRMIPKPSASTNDASVRLQSLEDAKNDDGVKDMKTKFPDECAERLVNPLLDYTFPISPDEYVPPQGSQLTHAAELFFPRPDTYPISYIARLLGFDVPVLDFDDSHEREDSDQLALLPKDKTVHSVPQLGRAFSMWEMQRYGESFVGDIVDPFFNMLLSEDWNNRIRKRSLLTPGLSKLRPFASETVQLAKECGLIPSDSTDFDKVAPYCEFEGKTGNLPKFWRFEARDTLRYKFMSWGRLKATAEKRQGEQGQEKEKLPIVLPNVLVIHDSSQVEEDALVGGEAADIFLLVLTLAIAMEHGRSCGIQDAHGKNVNYCLLEVHESLVEMLTTLFRMVPVLTETTVRTTEEGPVYRRLVCDLNNCSSKYAFLVLKKSFREATMPTPQKERLLVALSSLYTADDREFGRVYAGGGARPQQAQVGLRVKLHSKADEGGTALHFLNQEGQEKPGHVNAADLQGDLGWNLLKSFPLSSQRKPSGAGDEILELLKRKQRELSETEDALEPRGRALLEKTVEERREFHAREELRKQQQEIMEAFDERLNSQELEKECEQINEDMEAVCMLCDDGNVTHKNWIVFCQDCGLAVHQNCYGIDVVPEQDWFCSSCSDRQCAPSSEDWVPPDCELCPLKAGILQLGGLSQFSAPASSSRKWVHSLCAKWQELSVSSKQKGCNVYADPSDLIEQYNLLEATCCLCSCSRGAFRQCDYDGCEKQMHASCAKLSRQCKMIHGEDGHGDVLIHPWSIMCPEHSDIDTTQCQGVPLESLASHAAQRFAPEPEPFLKMSKEQQDRFLSSHENEREILQDLGLTGAKCEVCDVAYGKAMNKCVACDSRICDVCTEASEKEQSGSLLCGACSRQENEQGEVRTGQQNSCSVCCHKGGWVRKATAAPLVNVTKFQKNPHVFEKTLFAKELFCHTLCSRTFIELERQDVNNCVDLSNAILTNGLTFLQPKRECDLCGNSGGLKEACNNKNCKRPGGRGPHYFHASCARQAGFSVSAGEMYGRSFNVGCIAHSDSEDNLRVKIENMLHAETIRENKRGPGASLSYECIDQSMHPAIEIMRVLGWAWRWEEFWIKHNWNWEPFIPDMKEDQTEDDFTDEQKRIFHSDKKSRALDAQNCSLAAFGAALRNRKYDTPDGFDNESLDRALRAILETASLAGPLTDDEVDFLLEWLGRAYRSKSKYLGFGEDKIEIGPASFCYSGRGKSKTPKFELGTRPLPGFDDTFAVRQRDVVVPAKPSAELQARANAAAKRPRHQPNDLRGCEVIIGGNKGTTEHEKATSAGQKGSIPLSDANVTKGTPPSDRALKFKFSPRRLFMDTDYDKVSSTDKKELSSSTKSNLSNKRARADAEATNMPTATRSSQKPAGQQKSPPAGHLSGTIASEKAALLETIDAASEKKLPAAKKRSLSETDQAEGDENPADSVSRKSKKCSPTGDEKGVDQVVNRQETVEATGVKNSAASKKRGLSQMDQAEADEKPGKSEDDAGEDEEAEVDDEEDNVSAESSSQESVKTYHTHRTFKPVPKVPEDKKGNNRESLATANTAGMTASMTHESERKKAPHNDTLGEARSLMSGKMATKPSPAMKSVASRRPKRPQGMSPGAQSRASLRPMQQRPMQAPPKVAFAAEEEPPKEKFGLKGSSVQADEMMDDEGTGTDVGDCATFTGRHFGGLSQDNVSVLTEATGFPTRGAVGATGTVLDEKVKEARRTGFELFNGCNVNLAHLDMEKVSENHQCASTKRTGIRRHCVVCKTKTFFGCQECFYLAFENTFEVAIDRNRPHPYFKNKTLPMCESDECYYKCHPIEADDADEDDEMEEDL